MGLPERTASDELPDRIVVHDCALALDGGTIYLRATDEAGRGVSIMLTTTWGSPRWVAGRLYVDGGLVPMRSEREARILTLLSEARVQASRLRPGRRTSGVAIVGDDIRRFLEQSPEESCRAFIRQIVESVQSDDYLRFTTDEEKAITREAYSNDWERPSGKKKPRPWRRRRGG